jgi:hypothetical protein
MDIGYGLPSSSCSQERRRELCPDLQPQAALLQLETGQIDPTSGQVTLRVQSTQTVMHGPVCRFPTRRIDSRATRPVADLPWAAHSGSSVTPLIGMLTPHTAEVPHDFARVRVRVLL